MPTSDQPIRLHDRERLRDRRVCRSRSWRCGWGPLPDSGDDVYPERGRDWERRVHRAARDLPERQVPPIERGLEGPAADHNRGRCGDRGVCDYLTGDYDPPEREGGGGKPGNPIDTGRGNLVGNSGTQEGLILRAVARVARHGRWVAGPEVAECEREMAAFVGAQYAVGCNSGTDALILALKAARIGAGDRVIVPAFTFQATASAVHAVGAHPVFADIKENGYGIDVATVKEKADAIIGVDMFGIPADWVAITEFGKENRLAVIEDAAQAMGSQYGDRKCGSLATIGCTSFYPSKPLPGIGDGGMVFTSNPYMAEQVRIHADHGRDGYPFIAEVPGMNSRLDSLQAAVLLERLKNMDLELAHRRLQAQVYHGGCDMWFDELCAWSWYPILCATRQRRDDMLDKYGPLGAKVIYPIPLNRMPAFADSAVACPVAESVCERIIAFPIKHYWEENPCLDLVIKEEGAHG